MMLISHAINTPKSTAPLNWLMATAVRGTHEYSTGMMLRIVPKDTVPVR